MPALQPAHVVILPMVSWVLKYQSSRKCIMGLTTDQSGRDILSIDVFSSQMTLACFELT